jgi:hypothetical protein
VYRIRNWAERFENAETRKYKNLQWVPVPNRLDGDGITDLLTHPDGLLHFGVWVALLEIASKDSFKRGDLSRSGPSGRIGHTPATLARILRSSEAVISAAIERLLQIGWLEEVKTNLPESPEISGENTGFSGNSPAELNRIELNRTEEGRARAREETKNLDEQSEPVEIKPEDRWHLERLQPWAKALAKAGATIGAKQWQAWKAITDRYGVERTCKVAHNTLGQWKWPDDLAKIMAECEEEKPDESYRLALSDASMRALRVAAAIGSERVNAAMGWGSQSDDQIVLGLSDEMNAKDLLAMYEKAEV